MFFFFSQDLNSRPYLKGTKCRTIYIVFDFTFIELILDEIDFVEIDLVRIDFEIK